jgi:hypothetical protein
MSKQEAKSTQGGNQTEPADRQACKQLLKDVLFTISCGSSPEQIFDVLEKLLITYMASDVIEAEDRKGRDNIVTCYIDLKHIIKGLDAYNKLCKFSEQNPS